MLAVGGVWATPRNGIVLRKESEFPPLLVVHDVMPYMDGMPGTEEDLRQYQRDELESYKHQFGLAGIEIRGEIE